jgi:thiamine-phosphate pyrophosphorylase
MAQLYAIAGSMERARFMLESGAPYLQLRFKERPLVPHREEIRELRARFPETRLIINDDLDFALDVGAWGVHLGQEDLRRYDPERLRTAPLAVGISTHSDGEIERALDCGAALLGFGPIFATATKAVAHAPQGVERLRAVVRRLSLPIVAIGGITDENLDDVAATGVALVAMIAHLDGIVTAARLAALMHRLEGRPGPPA